jgi:TatA/E family protein of Tat protein translocase
MIPTPGPLELVIILVIALLILGPGKLPEVGASLGKSIREFRKASSDVQDSVKVDTSPVAAPAPEAAAAQPAVPAAPPTTVAPGAAADLPPAAAIAEPPAPVPNTASDSTTVAR